MAKVKASTQDHLDIEDIIDDLVILKTGWVALVMTTTSVNFDLLSEAEQDATIYAFGALLNSLSFPIQILIRSKKADITSYFQKLSEAAGSQPNPDLKLQIQKYQDFIQTIVQQKTVLDKKFYIIINFSPLELGLKGITGRKPTKNKSKSQLVNDAKIALIPKRDHLIKQMARLGLSTRQLTTQELIELFYDIYNPAPTGTQRVLLDTYSYTTPIVEPAVEIPTPAPSRPEALRRTGGSFEPEVRAGGQPMQSTVDSPSQRLGSPLAAQFTETNPVDNQPPSTILEPSTVNREPTTDLRPVPPNPSQGSPPIQNPNLNSVPNNPTAEALKNLQETTAKAAQLLNQQPAAGELKTPQPYSVNTTGNQSPPTQANISDQDINEEGKIP